MLLQVVGWAYAADLANIATWVQAARRQDPSTARLFEPLPPGAGTPE
jgi:hypothetical protein